MTRELTKADVASLEWMTLRDCANQARVPIEIVRQWCLRHESGLPGGLPSAHFGAKPADECKHRSRRVHVDDWRKFICSRRQAQDEQLADEVETAKRAHVEATPHYRSRDARRAAAGIGQGRSRS